MTLITLGSYSAAGQTDTLKNLCPIPLGVAIGYYPMKNNPVYSGIVSSQFDNVTFEYALKDGAIVRRDGQLNYAQADELVKICQAKGLHIYGHTLCWYQNNSPYLSTLHGDSATIEDFLKNYIDSTLTRYKDVIHDWDAVNEAIDSAGNLRTTGRQRPDFFYWGKWLGPGYIARVFQYAHADDPDALLFYNDYDLETDEAKLDAVVQLVKNLKKQGVPISGVGTQMHMDINTPDKGIDEAFKKLASTGLKVRISELDIKVNPTNDPNFVLTPVLAQKQAEKLRYVFQSFFTYVPKKQRFGITFWNLGDKDSWIVMQGRKDNPTLFDVNYRPKPAYYELVNYLHTLKPTAKRLL